MPERREWPESRVDDLAGVRGGIYGALSMPRLEARCGAAYAVVPSFT